MLSISLDLFFSLIGKSIDIFFNPIHFYMLILQLTNFFSLINECRASEKERDVYEDNRRTVLAVAAASFTLSFATQKNVKVLFFFIFFFKASQLHIILFVFLMNDECRSKVYTEVMFVFTHCRRALNFLSILFQQIGSKSMDCNISLPLYTILV